MGKPGIYVTETDVSKTYPDYGYVRKIRNCQIFVLKCVGVSDSDIELLDYLYYKEYKDEDVLKMKWCTVKPRISYEWYDKITRRWGPFRITITTTNPKLAYFN